MPVRHSTLARTTMTLLLAGASLWPISAQQPPRGHGRLFPPQDLGLLEAPDRDLWQRPERIMDQLGIVEASVVADIGAGSGWFTIRLSRRVGPQGIVYAQDVQQGMLNAITRRVQREGQANVRTILGTA
ncbi:MAG: class I SAM-dependent methyltransferase, partial [Acidobacteria bacterium]|nr:class I SAM-dependent methyltransferase [Acidobacteriota bacterium]